MHDLAPGYGIARFDRSTGEIRLEAWPRWADPTAGDAPYAGWPAVFNQTDNYGRKAAGYLPRLEVEGLEDPVVTVISDSIRPVNSTRLYPSYSIRRYGSAFRDPAVQLYYLPIFWHCLHRTDQEP